MRNKKARHALLPEAAPAHAGLLDVGYRIININGIGHLCNQRDPLLGESHMNKRFMVLFVALLFLLTGCAGMSPTEQNILGGGAIGAAGGAIIGGAAFGAPAAGAAIGAGAGLLGGALYDQYQRNRAYGY